MTLNVTGMSPITLDSTTLAISDLAFTPDIVSIPFRHSGNEFPSIGAKPGARPAFRYRTPWLAAYAYFGLKLKISSIVNIYFANFTAGLRTPTTASNTALQVNNGCTGCSYIDGFSIDQFGLVMADVVTLMLSKDGITHPFQQVAAQVLPVLGSQPALSTMGPYQLNAVRKDGARSLGFRQNAIVYSPINDGDSYPRLADWMGASPQFMIDHEDALQMVTDLTLMGLNIATNAVIWLADLDPTTFLRKTTGTSLTVTAGNVMVKSVPWNLNSASKASVVVESLSSTGVHPVTVATGAALP